jgi:Fe-S-cluster containining protein
MHAWMKRHNGFLEDSEDWFSRVLASYPEQMQCGRGCALCCHGLFDISFVDALVVADGFGRLSAPHQKQVYDRARIVQAVVERETPDLASPFFLQGLPESHVDRIVEAARSPRCPLLGDQDECLVYEFRPLACRLEGAPMIDLRDGPFGDWCELNFRQGLPPGAAEVLARDYYSIQAAEDTSNEVMTDLLLGRRDPEVTVFIPSVITEYTSFWHSLSAAASM